MCLNVLGRRGTGLRDIKVHGDFKVNQLHIGVDLAYQLPCARGVLFVNGTGLTLNRGRKWGEGNLP